MRKFREISLSSPQVIRSRFGNKPIQLLRLIEPELKFPKKIRILFGMLWREVDLEGNHATRFIVKGPRGGGKTKVMGAIGFAKWYLQLRNTVAMGGSLEQAKNVYNYFSNHCYSHDQILNNLPEEPTMQKTLSDKANYFKAVPASQKAVRGPHPDNLYIDEACEAKDELILSALPMVNTSPNSLVVMTSTFHKIFGLFQETWDRAPEYGYVRYSWDTFDVAQVFDPAIWKDAKLLREVPDFAISQCMRPDGTLDEEASKRTLEARAAGRTGDPEGWISIANIVQAWREKSSLDWFDVEYMGSRPSSSGMVNDPADVDACTIQTLQGYGYVTGAEVIGGLDWGFSSMTSWVQMMSHKDAVKVQVGAKNWSQVRSELIIEEIVQDVLDHRITVIYADSAGKFENAALKVALNKALRGKDFRCAVIEVVFSKDKELMLGNYRAYFQRHKLRIPKAYQEALWQHKRYRYKPGSDKPIKEDDHYPDATMCALKHWPLGRGASNIPKSNTEKEVQRQGVHKNITGGLLDERF